MITHKLLDVATIDPAAWKCEAGVYLAESCGEDKADYLGAALDDLGGESFLGAHDRKGVRDILGDSLIDSRFAAKGTCDHCGAWFKFGLVYRHTSGVCAVVGNTCASKTMSVDSRIALVLKRAKAAAEAKAAQVKFARERDAKLNAYLATAEGSRIAQFLLNCTKGFLGSMNEALHKWGSLTDAQHCAVLRIMDKPAPTPAAERAPSKHVGTVGERRVFEAVVLFVSDGRETQFGMSYVTKFLADTDVLTHFGSNPIGDKGDKLQFRATVKEHSDYNGEAQTVIARPSNVKTIEVKS